MRGPGDKDDKKQKRRQVTNILEWIQCYFIYMAVRVKKFPVKTCWTTKRSSLRQEWSTKGMVGWATTDVSGKRPDTPWSKIEPTLWNKAFAGQARASRCKYGFSLTHTAEDCDWAPTSRVNKQDNPSSSGRPHTTQICYEWNHTPSPVCSFHNCKYRHVCWYCGRDPRAAAKDHKAIYKR